MIAEREYAARNMGSRKLSRVVRRQTPGNGGQKQVASTPKPNTQHNHSQLPGVQRMKDLQSQLGNQKIQSILEKKPDPVGDPSTRDTLEKQARKDFLKVIERVPTLMAHTSQLMAIPPGPIETSPLLNIAIVGLTDTTQLLAQLDAAIQMFERAGGDITEIRPIIAIRAHLSTLMFFMKQICHGAPLGPMAQQTVQEAIQEGVAYQIELTLQQIPNDDGVEQGPITQGDDQKKVVLRDMLRRLYLGPPGMYPSASSLKST